MEVVAVVDVLGLCWVEVVLQLAEVLLVVLGLALSSESILD